MGQEEMTEKTFEGRNVLWVIHIGNNDRIAMRARDKGFVCIGWAKLGDLSKYKTREALKEAMVKTWPDWKPRSVSSCYGQVWRFAHEIMIGDPIVLPIKATREIAIGQVSSNYRYAGVGSDLYSYDLPNIREVQWHKVVPRTVFTQAALHSLGSFSTVSTSNDFLEEVIAVLHGKLPEPDGDEEDGTSGGEAGDEVSIQGPNLYETALQETEDALLKAWVRTGARFEHVVAAVFRAMGYTANVTQASGDHGVDIIAHPDPLGLQPPFIKVQVKSGSTSIGEPQVNQLKGALNAGEQGIVVSLGGFTTGAQNIARTSSTIRIIDAKQFASLFLDHYDRLDPSWQAKFPLKRVFVPIR
jgi:restriction system protein